MAEKAEQRQGVGHGEPVIRPARPMALYDTHELISQLKAGSSQASRSLTSSRQVDSQAVANPTVQAQPWSDRPVQAGQPSQEVSQSVQPKVREQLASGLTAQPLADRPKDRSSRSPEPEPQPEALADLARREARADLKKKRQALVTAEKPLFQRAQSAKVSQERQSASQATGLAKYAQRLRQEDYILAELPKTYEQPTNPSTKGGKKNSYDFLKRSQIYNHRDNQLNKERQIAQELNLSRLEDGE